MRHQSGSVTTKFQISKGDLFADENSVPVFSIVEVTTYAQLIQPLTPDIQLTFSFDQESKNNQEKLPKKLTQPVYYDIPIKVKDILKVDYDFDGGLKRKSHLNPSKYS